MTGALRWSPAVRVLVLAVLISKLGNQLLIVAVPLAVLQSTGSGSAAVLSFAVQTLPFAASPVLGLLVDRYSRLVVYGVCEAVQGVSVVALALTLHTSTPSALILLAFASTGAVMSGIVVNFVLIPALVPVRALPKINGLFSGASQIISLAGLPLGGLVFELFDARITLFLDAGTFLFTLGSAFLIPASSVPRGRPKPVGPAMRQGWRFVREDSLLLRLSVVLGLGNLGAGCLSVVILQTATAQWHWPAGATGLAMGIGAVGAAAGAALGSRRRAGCAVRPQLTGGLVAAVAGAAVMLVLRSSPMMLAGLLVLSVGEGIVNVRSVLVRQTRIPAELTGRVNTLIRTMVAGTIPLSAIIQAPLETLSLAARLAVPVLCGGLAILVWLSRSVSRQALVAGSRNIARGLPVEKDLADGR